jgi:hypothetical protein
MSIRTTSDAVKAILLDNYGVLEDGTEPSLAPYIEAASSLIDDAVGVAAGKGKPLSSAKQELLERWVAGHCYMMMDPQTTSESQGGGSAGFAGQFGMQLTSTRYGQTALMLDTSGALAALGANGSRATAGGFWLGKTREERRA